MRGHCLISIKNEMNASDESCLLYTGLKRTSALPFSLECSQNKVTSKEKAQDICVEFFRTVGYIHKNLIIHTNIIHE